MDVDIYKEIAKRTDGDIYIGVVGPVRTGKSTFIKRFMDLFVIPNIEDEYKKERAKDELPQSAQGKTIMTTEPKFVPNEAVEILLDDNAKMRVRLVDCVGYLVEGAMGHLEENHPRMVTTPWFEKPIPFEEAAEIGTKKVIQDHSTIGIVITTDGTITEIPRENYIKAEERVIEELKALQKPFVIVLNTAKPYSPDTQELKKELEEKYKMPVLIVNCLQLQIEDVKRILESVLFEFPIIEVKINFPKWFDELSEESWLKREVYDKLKEYASRVDRIRHIKEQLEVLKQLESIGRCEIVSINLGDGKSEVCVYFKEGLLFKIIEESTGFEIKGDHHLLKLLSDLSKIKQEYDKLKEALDEAKEKGYGIVAPSLDELSLETPEIVKRGNSFGVRLKASAPSLHIIRVEVETEVSPIVGTEKQSEELVNFLMKEFEDDPKKIWESNIFGKSLHELVKEGLQNKLYRMPEDAQAKLKETLQKIINEGSGGLICIIL
ncbi:stage IV sporulation protein A [Caldicellulosiruptor changbaiensis]|uniref:Stage IV sporulation protein A n=1 Tax=Caldicellulosiruptor changbaiensis TaxID=1222016 RepID=A0A3T0D860_9FIRM|nr:stage IV sporulation protein A [Caldicellulosiruptor changbaiensis]AZT91327.1 stage IV sporulation protein A [Caldicellulosiruptor changbaiensis]